MPRLDKGLKNKASDDDWESPAGPDARVAKMTMKLKGGNTRLARDSTSIAEVNARTNGRRVMRGLDGAKV